MSARFTADVVSAQFPCGAAWLANALLELQVALPELWGFDTAREWRSLTDGRYRYIADDLPWRQTLAALHVGREFHWQTGHRVRFTHTFPWQLASAQRCVVVVRDPRDALHSEWHRQQRNQGLANTVDLPAFAASPFWSGPISQADCLWLHLSSWLAVAEEQPERVHVLRFEDCKHEPVDSLQRAVRFLGIAASDDAIRGAASASDVRHLKHIESALIAAEGSRLFNRAGIAFEWQQTWPAAWHEALGPHWDKLLARLCYSPRLRPQDTARLQATSALLNATGVTTDEVRTHWEGRLQRWQMSESQPR